MQLNYASYPEENLKKTGGSNENPIVKSWEVVALRGTGTTLRTYLPTPYLCLKSRTTQKTLWKF